MYFDYNLAQQYEKEMSLTRTNEIRGGKNKTRFKNMSIQCKIELSYPRNGTYIKLIENMKEIVFHIKQMYVAIVEFVLNYDTYVWRCV